MTPVGALAVIGCMIVFAVGADQVVRALLAFRGSHRLGVVRRGVAAGREGPMVGFFVLFSTKGAGGGALAAVLGDVAPDPALLALGEGRAFGSSLDDELLVVDPQGLPARLFGLGTRL